MKRISVSWFLPALLFGFSFSLAQATPLYYTFTGTVIAVEQGQIGYPTVGSGVIYKFLVDTEQDGIDSFNGTTHPKSDTGSYDYFLAEYVSGSAVARPAVGQIAYSNSCGYSYDNSHTYLIGSHTEFNYNEMSIHSSQLISDWVVGTEFTGYDSVIYDGASGNPVVWSQLTLTSIAPVNAVPEPSTMLLPGSSLLGLAGLNRRRKA